MKHIRILLAGAVAILATASATPIVGHAETVTQPQSYNVEAHYDADNHGVSNANEDYEDVDTSKDPSYVSFSESRKYNDVYAWKHTTQYDNATNGGSTSNTSTTSTVSQAVQSDGWNAVSASEIYYNKNGAHTTGWQKIGLSWYYFGTDGKMQFDKWVQSSGNWYYMLADGRMATYCLVNGYFVNNSGAYDSSRNNSNYGSGVYGVNGVPITITIADSSKNYTNSEFEALRSNGSLGARVIKQVSNGTSSMVLDWYMK